MFFLFLLNFLLIHEMSGFLSHLKPDRSEIILYASCGPVRGNIYRHGVQTVHGYLGMPYAKAPVGSLRFQKPEAADVWTEPRDCYEYGPGCPQSGKYASMLSGRVEFDEDNCLTLNVFTPDFAVAQDQKLPVMVYIHGGGFEAGASAAFNDFSVSGTLPLKGIVLVSINYRLGPLGFLTTGSTSCRGNFGLWDQTLALKWVQKHIPSFGGNPKSVTVFGTSAGGASADMLALSPHSRDLFHRYIAMSAVGISDLVIRTSKTQVKVFEKFAELHGYRGKDPESLLQWYDEQAVEKFAEVANFSQPASGFLYFLPTLDDDFFPRPFDVLRKEGGVKDIILTVGEFEGLGMIGGNPGWINNTPNFEQAIGHAFGEDVVRNPEEVHQVLLNHYTEGIAENDTKALTLKLVEFLGDSWFNLPALLTAKSASKHGSNVYLASFDYFNPKDLPAEITATLPFVAATHGSDLQFVLGDSAFMPFRPDRNDLRMMDFMTTIYSDFSKFGNPNGHNNTQKWKKFDVEYPEMYFKIDEPKSEMRDSFQNGRLRFLEEVITKERKYNEIVNGK